MSIPLVLVIGPVGCGKSSVGALLAIQGYYVVEVDNIVSHGWDKNKIVHQTAKAAFSQEKKIPVIINGGGIFTSIVRYFNERGSYIEESFLDAFKVVGIFSPTELATLVTSLSTVPQIVPSSVKMRGARRRRLTKKAKVTSSETSSEVVGDSSIVPETKSSDDSTSSIIPETFGAYWNSPLQKEKHLARTTSDHFTASRFHSTCEIFQARRASTCDHRARSGIYQFGPLRYHRMNHFPSSILMHKKLEEVTKTNFEFQLALLEWGYSNNIPIYEFAYDDITYQVKMLSVFPRGELSPEESS